MNVDRSSRAPPSVHGPRGRARGRSLSAPGADQVAAGRPAQHRHPGGRRGLELPGPVGRGHGAARRVHQRARLSTTVNGIDAHRVAVDPRHRPAQGLLPAGRRHRRRHRPDQRRCRSTILRIMPPGHARRPNVIQFNASNVPVAQLTVASDTLPEQQIFDYGLNFLRRAAVHHPRPVDARAVRRQAAGRSRWTSTRARCGARASSPSDVVQRAARRRT